MSVTQMSEKLHPVLRRHLQPSGLGKALEHPLVVGPYTRSWNAIYNRQYRDKLNAIERAKTARDWLRIIWLYERRFRVEALHEIADSLTDEQYWRAAGAVWLDAEVISPNRLAWTQIWLSKRPGRDRLMTGAEYQRFAELGDDAGWVAIYRGCGEPRAVRGLSWTVERDLAMTFATRHASPLLVSATVRKANIQAYFERKDGAEVVVLPRHCRDLVVTPLAQMI